jgi:hypothetical protein
MTIEEYNNLNGSMIEKGGVMKLTRLSLLLAVLLMSIWAAPEAFGAKGKDGSGLLHRSLKRSLAAEECYDVYCFGVLQDEPCCGSEDYCLGYCDATCHVSQGTCVVT